VAKPESVFKQASGDILPYSMTLSTEVIRFSVSVAFRIHSCNCRTKESADEMTNPASLLLKSDEVTDHD